MEAPVPEGSDVTAFMAGFTTGCALVAGLSAVAYLAWDGPLWLVPFGAVFAGAALLLGSEWKGCRR